MCTSKGIEPPLGREVYIKGNRTTFGHGSVHQREQNHLWKGKCTSKEREPSSDREVYMKENRATFGEGSVHQRE